MNLTCPSVPSEINDKYGHEKGDEYLQTAAALICRVFQHSPVFRIGGDEFTAVLQNEDYHSRAGLLDLFAKESETNNEAAENDWEKVMVSFGLAEYDSQIDHSVEDTVARADRLMYENKRARKGARGVR